MSANRDALDGEIITASEIQPGAKCCLYCCDACGRVVMDEAVFITADNRMLCVACEQLDYMMEGD